MSEHDVCAAADIADGALLGVQAADCKILLARLDGTLHAIGGVCPHAGADLADGVLHDGQVICPWHKAAFALDGGACTAPPAVDDLPRFDVREQAGRVLVRLPGHMAATGATGAQADPRCMAIIGAGAAGAVAAQTLRRAGFSGRVVMIGREDALPYDRTVLSKYALSNTKGAEKSPLQSALFYNSHVIERRTAEVTSIDPHRRRIGFADGTALAYDAALLATGGAARHPRIEGAELPGVFVLRDAADAEAIAAASDAARHCVVLGAGFIGMEVAASLCERGMHVTVVAPQSAPFEPQLGARIGHALAGLHREHGIAFHLGRSVMSITGTDRVERVVLDDGTELAADIVVAGLGIKLRTDMLAGVERDEDGGVAVDAGMQVMEGLFAAGDIARFPLYGTSKPTRVEHWRVAEQHGRIAALNMLGGNERFTATPYFWTIHFRKRLDYVGHAERWDDIVVDGDLEARDFLAFYVTDGIVRAVAGIGRDNAMGQAIGLFDPRRNWTVDALKQALG